MTSANIPHSDTMIVDDHPPWWNPARLPPLEKEVLKHAKDRLRILLLQDAELEKKELNAQAVVDGYRRKRQALLSGIYYYRGVGAPVRHLPKEILQNILMFLVDESPDDIGRVCLVCTEWNKAALWSKLWTNIVITGETYQDVEKVHAFQKRSQNDLLRISYNQTYPVHLPTSWKAYHTLTMSASRWRTLTLAFNDCRSASNLIGVFGPTPRLEEMSVTIRRQCRDPAHEGEYGFNVHNRANAPSLRSLNLTTFVLPRPGGCFVGLTKLHVVDTFTDLGTPLHGLRPIRAKHILAVLKVCPKLEDFSFNAERTAHWFVTAEPIVPTALEPVCLPTLRRLCIICHFSVAQELMKNLVTKKLIDMTLRALPRAAVQSDSGFGTATALFLKRTLELRSLSFYSLYHCAVLAGSVVGFDFLERLHLDFVSPLDVFTERLSSKQPCFEGMVRLEPYWYAPSLSELIIDANWFDVEFDKLAAAVKARYLANLEHGTPARIRRLIVNGQDLLKGAAPGEISMYARPQRFVGIRKDYAQVPVRSGVSGM